jgi:peroxiredoxin Q/BCP
MLKVGDKVPKLKGVLQDGSAFALSSLAGKPYVIYFYPKDMTPGCTVEAQDFQSLHAKFRKRGAEIVGVSRDAPASHEKFAAKHDLKFPLIADTDETWCNAFDVIGEKVLYGKKHVGVIRSTFLVGADGRIVAEWRKVRVPGHAQAVLERLAEQ